MDKKESRFYSESIGNHEDSMLFFEYVFTQTAWELAMTTSHQTVLRIRDVYPGSRIRIKEFNYFNPKNGLMISEKYDSGCSSWIRIPDPGSKRHRIPDKQHCHQRSILKIRKPGEVLIYYRTGTRTVHFCPNI
jgi:hypothetical protein